MSFEIERLVGGLTPANPGDPRTFPAIWNDTADELEAVEGRVTTAEGDISSLDGRLTTAEGDIGQLQTDITSLVIDDLTDVDTDGKADGDLLRYDATAGEWKPDTLAASDLTDVDTAGSTAGDLLRFDGTGWGPDTLDTDDVVEAGNLYYTDARVEAVIAASDTDDLAEGATNLYYTDARAESAADGRIAAATTDDLSEGTTNLYFTDQRADDRADGRIAAATTDALTEGASNLYYTDGRASAAAPVQSVNTATGDVVLDTDDIDEGAGNLYYTDGRAAAAAPVQSVNTQTGAVSLGAADVGAFPDDGKLGDLDDVSIAGITDGQLIAYQASTDTFIPASPAGITTADITGLDLVWNDF